jgi:O-antigen biosynthesis protein WbqV
VARVASLDDCDFSEMSRGAVAVLCMRPSPEAARSALARAVEAGVFLKIADGGGVRDLALPDLIGPVSPANGDDRLSQFVAGKRVLITGGAGSIGGELARKLAAIPAGRLTLLDSSECNLYKTSLELPQAVLALADIRDRPGMRRWLEREQPDVVFHAAALKQVPLVEAFPCEGVQTNVLGLRNVAEAAQAVGADLVFVSTDKAVDPTGVMGACKRLGEMFCQALDCRRASRAVTVRLGNVLGSAGSVAPLFEAQVAARRPLTVTDAEVSRYFLSIPQAADALLRAATAALAGETPRGATLVIDMGEPLPIIELARAVIRLAGLRPEADLPIVTTGLRPGERLHEQLMARCESVVADADAGITAVASPARSIGELNGVIERLEFLARAGADAELKSELFAALETGAASERRLAGAAN